MPLPNATIDCGSVDTVITAIVGFGGVALGALLTAWLTRRNERRSRAEDLLVQALNLDPPRGGGFLSGVDS